MKIATTTCDLELLKEDHIEKVRILAEAGFRYIDFSFYNIDKEKSPFMTEGWQEYVKELKQTAEELGVKFVQAHSPVGNPFKDEGYDDLLASTIRSIEVCGMLGIEDIVVHSGWAEGIGKEEFFARNREFYRQLFPAMERYHVSVLIENSAKANMGDFYYFLDGAEMREFLDYVDHPLLNACWDTGHANIEGHQYEDIMALGERLKALHINDNLGYCDQHIAPFMGTLSVDEVVKALIDSGFKGYFTFEACDVVKNGKHWLQMRHPFEGDERLYNPPIAVYKAMEKFIFEIGRAIMEAYGLYEE